MSTYTTTALDTLGNNLEALTLKQEDLQLYGSSRLGTVVPSFAIVDQANNTGPWINPDYRGATYYRGYRQYELSNHLGNVLTTISDRRIGVYSGSSLNLPGGYTVPIVDYYNPDMVSATDYYPFGMVSRGVGPSDKYRFGFNGKENDNEVKGFAQQQDYGMRVYDPRVGRFLSVDPLTAAYPMLTPYQFSSNTPIAAIDLDGKESSIVTVKWYTDRNGTVLNTVTSDIYVQPKGAWSFRKKETIKEEVAKEFVALNKLPPNGYWQYIEFANDPEKNYAVYLYFDETGASKDAVIPHEKVKEWLDHYVGLHKDAAKFWEVTGHVANLAGAGTLMRSEFKALSSEFGAEAKAMAAEAGAEAKALSAEVQTTVEPRYVFRGLSSEDIKSMEAGKGINARNPNANNSAVSHVAGKADSRWISTTKSEEVAKAKYGANGYVKIDLNKVPSDKVDVSKGFPYMKGGQINNWAKKDQELLVEKKHSTRSYCKTRIMTQEQIEQLELAWDYDNGFLGKLRQGTVDKMLYPKFILLIRSISFDEDELLPSRAVSLLWYIPLFMQWQTERVQKEISIDEYNNLMTEIENELERILGIP